MLKVRSLLSTVLVSWIGCFINNHSRRLQIPDNIAQYGAYFYCRATSMFLGWWHLWTRGHGKKKYPLRILYYRLRHPLFHWLLVVEGPEIWTSKTNFTYSQKFNKNYQRDPFRISKETKELTMSKLVVCTKLFQQALTHLCGRPTENSSA